MWSVRSEETWTPLRQSWKLEKTLDRVEQAEPRADHITNNCSYCSFLLIGYIECTHSCGDYEM